MSQELLQIIKKAAMDAVETSNPMTLAFGTIESVNPLVVKIEQKASFEEFFLIQTDT
ncbi:TPA: DUF2577 family protein, partial [Clostridioides difficile]|nr:DUF2577 family protein [Clostridioides difficile]